MPDPSTKPIDLPGVKTEAWLIRFDKGGVCTSPAAAAALLDRLGADHDRPVILFSHGWNNEFNDATTLYSTFLKCLEDLLAQVPLNGPPPIFVGIIWPSTWLSFDEGPAIASAGAPSPETFESLKQQLGEALKPERRRARLYTLLEQERVATPESSELAQLIADALAEQLGATSEGSESDRPDGDAILRAWGEADRSTTARNTGGGDELEEGGTIDSGQASPLRDAGFLDALDPRWALRLASVYLMKDRAGTVGTKGVSVLISGILKSTKAPLHAVGHSYGAKVILSAIAGAGLNRPVASVLLLQPAISHLCFASTVPGRTGEGGYASLLRTDRIAAPIVTTFSGLDHPLHDIFHLLLRRKEDLGELKIAATETAAGQPPNAYAALGGYGPRGAHEQLREPLPDVSTPIALPIDVPIIGYDGTLQRIIDAHGDVATPHTAWLLHQLMKRGAQT